MKKSFIAVISILIAIVAFAGLAGCAATTTGGASQPLSVALSSQQQQGVWVSGMGEVTVVPDVANITLGVSAQAATVAEAQQQASNAMTKVMDALIQGGVAKNDIQTQQFSIQQVTRYDKDTQQNIVIGYLVTNTVNAKLRDINKAGNIIDAVAAAGGDLTRVNGISFSVDDPTRYYNDARQKAMNDAKTKANQLADLGGIKLGNPTYITEGVSYPGPRSVYSEAMSGGAVPAPIVPPISAGETKITVNVQVAYSIQ